MTLSEFADIAELMGGIGVILSLLLLAWELHKNAEQTRLGNWHSMVAAFREHKRRTDDLAVADVIVRGRKDFHGLSEAEELLFGFWMEEWILAQDGLIQSKAVNTNSHVENLKVLQGNFRVMF
jgi:hypothetical protein